MLHVAVNAGDYHYAIVVIKWWSSRSASFRWPTYWRLVKSEWWLCAKDRVRNDEFGQAVRWGRGRGGSQNAFQLDEQQQRAQQAAKRTWWRRGCRQGGLHTGGEAVDGSVCDTCGRVSVWHLWTGQCGTLVDGSVWDTCGTFPNPLSVRCVTFWTLCPCAVWPFLNSLSLRCYPFELSVLALWLFFELFVFARCDLFELCPRAVLTFSNSLPLCCVDLFELCVLVLCDIF